VLGALGVLAWPDDVGSVMLRAVLGVTVRGVEVVGRDAESVAVALSCSAPVCTRV